tara:strand:+ start:296 stop:877 length:582 start_codon:yes stop_codon:yes gene_type:complete
MKNKHLLIFCFFHLFPSIYFSQFNPLSYNNLEIAILNKDSVFHLDLSKQKLKQIPKEVFEFKNLKILYLNKNKLDEIPKEISKLKQLQKIELSKNNFTVFPIYITQIKSLKTLIINKNKITNIPKEISNLINLEKLDLWSNEIKNIPNEISSLKKLEELDLRVIQFNEEEQKRVIELLPNTKVHFSKSCNCGY